jgi:hypothetical protein
MSQLEEQEIRLMYLSDRLFYVKIMTYCKACVFNSLVVFCPPYFLLY